MSLTSYRAAPPRDQGEGIHCPKESGMQEFFFALSTPKSYCFSDLSGGVTVALGPLEASVMVRIHAGQPVFSF